MSVLSFLHKAADGCVEVYDALTSSLGATDANKIIATNADGKIDPSFLPTGVEIQVETMTSSSDFTAGDFVNIYDNGGTRTARLALANDVDRIACGFVLADTLTGDTVEVYTKGVNTSVTGDESVKYFLSPSVGGDATATAPPVVSGHFQQTLGIGVGTGILFEFDAPIYFP